MAHCQIYFVADGYSSVNDPICSLKCVNAEKASWNNNQRGVDSNCFQWLFLLVFGCQVIVKSKMKRKRLRRVCNAVASQKMICVWFISIIDDGCAISATSADIFQLKVFLIFMAQLWDRHSVASATEPVVLFFNLRSISHRVPKEFTIFCARS